MALLHRRGLAQVRSGLLYRPPAGHQRGAALHQAGGTGSSILNVPEAGLFCVNYFPLLLRYFPRGIVFPTFP